MTTKVKLIADGAITPDQITLTTASAGTNTTAPATTAFVQQEITALVDSSPAALNTLNELAAALGDDANFSTTVTNSIALKAPLASPTFTGTVEIPNLTISSAQGSDGQVLTSTGSGIAWEDAAGGVDGIVSSADATAITIDSNENVGIKESSPSATLHTNSGTANIGIHQESTDSGSYISFSDNSTTSISYVLLGAVGNDLVFNAGDTERLRILSSGGLTFNGDTAAANALDDYEEGTWRPTVAGATTAGTYTYGENAGVYTKIGNQVTCSFYILELGATTDGSGALIINNLPFTVASITAGTVLDYYTGNVTFENFDIHTSAVNLASHAIAGTTHITFFETKDASLDGTVVTTDRVDGNADIIGQITYRTT